MVWVFRFGIFLEGVFEVNGDLTIFGVVAKCELRGVADLLFTGGDTPTYRVLQYS